MALFQALELAGESEIEVTKEHVESISVDRPLEKSAMLCNRLIHLLGGPALMFHQSVVLGSGLEAWRLLRKRYDPKTTLRNLQLWLKIMNPGKVKKSQDFLVQVNRWESWVNTLKRDYQQDVAETSRVGLLIMMAPDELQWTILEHADRLQNYVQVKENMVMLLDAGADCTTPTPWTWDTLERTVIAGQSLVWKTRTLALLDEEIIAIDVEAWVTLQTIAALRRVKGREGKTKGMAEGLG